MQWKKLIDTDLPPMGPITDVSRENTKRYAAKYRGSVRISLGRFPTDEEYENHRKKSLTTPLP